MLSLFGTDPSFSPGHGAREEALVVLILLAQEQLRYFSVCSRCSGTMSHTDHNISAFYGFVQLCPSSLMKCIWELDPRAGRGRDGEGAEQLLLDHFHPGGCLQLSKDALHLTASPKHEVKQLGSSQAISHSCLPPIFPKFFVPGRTTELKAEDPTQVAC